MSDPKPKKEGAGALGQERGQWAREGGGFEGAGVGWGGGITEGGGVGSDDEPVRRGGGGGGGGWDGDGGEGRERLHDGGGVAGVDDRLRRRQVQNRRHCSAAARAAAAAAGLQKLPGRDGAASSAGDEDGGGGRRGAGGEGVVGALEHLHADERGDGADRWSVVQLQEDRADVLAVRGRPLVHARGNACGAGGRRGVVVRDGAGGLEEELPVMPAAVALCRGVVEDGACWGVQEEAGGAASLRCPLLRCFSWERLRQRLWISSETNEFHLQMI